MPFITSLLNLFHPLKLLKSSIPWFFPFAAPRPGKSAESWDRVVFPCILTSAWYTGSPRQIFVDLIFSPKAKVSSKGWIPARDGGPDLLCVRNEWYMYWARKHWDLSLCIRICHSILGVQHPEGEKIVWFSSLYRGLNKNLISLFRWHLCSSADSNTFLYM